MDPIARRPVARSLSVLLMTGLLCDVAGAQYTSRGPEVQMPPAQLPADAMDIVLKGEQVCLQRLPDASGRVRLDCAIGLRGDDDQFYGLRAADPNRIDRFPQMNVRVRVTGKLIPHGSGQFVEAGQIVYASIEPIPGELKPVTGTFVCLVPRSSGARPVDKCRNAIETDRGLHWGLDRQSLEAIPAARGLAVGDRIAVEGEIVRDLSEDWHPWMFPADAQRMEGVLKVRSLKPATAR